MRNLVQGRLYKKEILSILDLKYFKIHKILVTTTLENSLNVIPTITS